MPRTRVRIEKPLDGIELKGTIDAIHELMKNFTIDSLKDFVGESTRPIPVWSGAARATFLKLATQARMRIDIRPVAKIGSRIPLGRARSEGIVFAQKGEVYGWEWKSDLAHISIVQDRVNFVDAGLESVKRTAKKLPELPGVEIKRKGKK